MVATDQSLKAPTLGDVYRARKVLQHYLPPTPILKPASLSRELGFEVVLKCENFQPIGAFKVRGGIYYMSRLSESERARGVVSASTGNHAQSVAYGAREFGARAVIFMPENPNPAKLAATEALGAEVIQFGKDFDECRMEAARYAQRENMRFIHAANEPDLIAGVATYVLELMEAEPDLDVVITPLGGGSGLCGTGLVVKGLNPDATVWGVQAEQMPAAARAFHEHKLVALEGGTTWAEGLATRVAFELPFEMMQELVDDVGLVSEEEMRQALLSLMEHAHILAEGAGAASTALAVQRKDQLQGKKVGIVVSGGNVSLDVVRKALTDTETW